MEPKRKHGYRTHNLTNTLRMECGVTIAFTEKDRSCFSCSRETDEGVLRRTCGVWSRDNASALEYRSSFLPTRLHLARQSIGKRERSNAFLYAIHFKLQYTIFYIDHRPHSSHTRLGLHLHLGIKLTLWS
jgi:hypothetical protein